MKSSTRMAVGRLAPSPTGALHVGNARSFLLAWLSIRLQAGQLLLRIEDIDSPRIKTDSIPQTIADLQWLGLTWEMGPDTSKPSLAVPLVQSARLSRYREILSQLIENDLVYPCHCTRSDVQAAASAPHDTQHPALDGLVYPGTCRQRQWHQRPPTGRYSWRWRFRRGRLQWSDDLRGPQALDPQAELGDFVIARVEQAEDYRDVRHAIPAYQLAVVVDDYDSGVNEVLRGDDLIFSTYRQLAILNELGWPVPRYLHVPLVVGPDGRRLAKRHGDTRLSTLRDLGVRSAALVGYMAWTVGLLGKPRAVSPLELAELLVMEKVDWQRCIPSHPTTFDLPEELPRLLEL